MKPSDADSEALLAEMREQYEFATLESHMLVDGVLYLRCKRCGQRPVPHNWSFAAWCDECLDVSPTRSEAGS